MTNKIQLTFKKIGAAIVVCCFMFIFAWLVALTMGYVRDGSLVAIVTALPLVLMCALTAWRVRQRPATISVEEPAPPEAIAPFREAITEEIRIKMTGYSDAAIVEDLFASNLIDIAFVDEVSADCIFVVADSDIDVGVPENFDWVTSLIKGVLDRAGETAVQFVLDRRQL